MGVRSEHSRPKYVCCNADESEPGTFNNRAIMEWDPHIVVEGVMIASYAIGATHSFIYCRGEFGLPAERLTQAIRDAEKAGFLGTNIFGKGIDLDDHRLPGRGRVYLR